MMARTFDLRWGRVVVAGVVATVLAFAVVFLVVAVYAASLATQAQGAPDPDQIARFAEGTGAWLGPVLALLFTVGAAWLVAQRGLGGGDQARSGGRLGGRPDRRGRRSGLRRGVRGGGTSGVRRHGWGGLVGWQAGQTGRVTFGEGSRKSARPRSYTERLS
jgi:hypothetical protein